MDAVVRRLWFVVILVMLAVSPATAAVTVGPAGLLFGPTAPANGANAATATITPSGANKVLQITVNLSDGACANPASAVTGVSDNQGQTYTLLTPFKMSEGVGGCAAGQWRGQQAVAYTINPANVATTVSVTISLVGSARMVFGGVVYNGADQTTPITNLTSLYQLAGPATITRSVTSASGNIVSDVVCNGTAVPTVANGQTSQWSGGADLSNNCASAGTGTVAGASSFSDTWNVDAGDTSSITSFNVVAAGGAGVPSPPSRTLLGVGV